MKRLVFVARPFFDKGVEYLVKAAPVIVSRHPVELVIVGDGAMRGAVKRMTQGLRIRHAYRLVGRSPRISKILRESDIFVRPSLTEGLPLAVLEAMACHLPAFATRVPRTSEIMTDGVTGPLCTTGVLRSLATAILELLEDPEMAPSRQERDGVRETLS